MMIKLLIVDDEPLIQVGIKSMVSWKEHNIEICGTASNGKEALSLIEKHSPHLIITDIKMPIMDGLELAKLCKERYGHLPLFIILTSHQEFSLIKEGVKYGILDYLIKLELTKEVLLESINKAKAIINETCTVAPVTSQPLASPYFYDKFFISLLHNFIDSQVQFTQMTTQLNLDFSYPAYVVAQCTFESNLSLLTDSKALTNLYLSSLEMIQEITPKHHPCYICSLDLKQFCIIFCLNKTEASEYKIKLTSTLQNIATSICNYFNVTLYCSVGRVISDPMFISTSYQDARHIAPYLSSEMPILFFEGFTSINGGHYSSNTFNMGLFKEDIQKAFKEYDSSILNQTLSSIIDLFQDHSNKYVQAMDAACNILYLSLSLLPNGEEILASIFSDYLDGYLSIYKQTTLEQILNWMQHLNKGLCHELDLLHKSYKNRMIANVQKHIDEHITEKLSLIDVATLFGITPNYLSLLFKKHADIGFSEYINKQKIEYAKTLLDTGQLKIYEIADQLGFESAFYFSKVFKKVEGCSPRDYKQFK